MRIGDVSTGVSKLAVAEVLQMAWREAASTGKTTTPPPWKTNTYPLGAHVKMTMEAMTRLS